MNRTTNPRRGRKSAAAFLVAGVVMIIAPFAMPVAGADSSAFIGFNLSAIADPFSLQGGQQSSQGYPQVVAQVGHTETKLATGPSGYALSSILWPGQFAGNLGSLVQAFGAPPEAAQINYPVRAEAFSPAGPLEASQPGMTARTDGDFAEAIAQVPLQGADGFEIASVSSLSRTEVVGSEAISHAETVVTGVSLGGGVVTIESITSVAEARSNGSAGSHGGEIVVSGLEVGGNPATITDQGLRFGDATSDNPVNAVAQQVGEQILSNLGMEIWLSSPTVRDEGATQEFRSGSLVIFWDPFNQGQGDGTVVLGGSSAFAQAAPALPAPTFPEPTVPTTAPPAPVTTPPTVLSGGVSSPPPAVSPPASPIVSDPAPTPTAAAPLTPVETVAPPTELVRHFDGFGPGAVGMVLAGAALAQVGLVKFQMAAMGG